MNKPTLARGIGLVALSICVLGSSARAQRALTLDEALDLARRNNRDLKAAQENIAQADATVERTRAQLLPTVSAQGKYTYNYPSATLDASLFTGPTIALAQAAQTGASAAQAAALQAYATQAQAAADAALHGQTKITIVKENQLDLSAQASVPLVMPASYPALQAAKAQRHATESNLAVTTTSLLLSAANGFYRCAGADELVQARGHAVEVAQRTVENARVKLDAGMVNRIEVTRAELAYVQAVQRLTEAKDADAQAYRSLATLIQLRDPFVVRPSDRTRGDEPVAALQKQALELRPEVHAYEADIVAQQKQVLADKLKWAPTLQAFARAAVGNYAGFSGKEYSFAAGVQLDWSIYDGGVRSSQQHDAESQQRQYELELAQLRDTIDDDVAQAARELETKRAALATAQKSVALSQESLDLIRTQHDAGNATQLDLLQAQDSLVSSEVGLAQARFDLATSQINLDRLSGRFGPRGPETARAR